MEATAGTPGMTGTHKGTRAAGGHIHQLISLAVALTAAAAAGTSAAGTVPDPLGVSLQGLGDAEAIEWGRTVEQLSRHVQALQVQVAGTLATRALEGRYLRDGDKTPSDVLANALHLSRAEAGRRLRLAEHFLPVTDPISTVTTPPDQPILATAFFTGTATEEQALAASGFIADAAHLAQAGRVAPGQAREFEQTMTDHAKTQNPDFLRRVGTHALTLMDPDGQKPTEGELTAKQGIFFHRPYRGLVRIAGYTTVAQYEKIMAFIGFTTNPGPHKDINTINADAAPDSPGNAGPGIGDVSGLSGQTDLMDVLRAAAEAGISPETVQGTAPAPEMAPPPAQVPAPAPAPAPVPVPEDSWPPPQGPPPDWAQSATNTSCGSNTSDGCGDGRSDDGDWIFPQSTQPEGIGWEPQPTGSSEKPRSNGSGNSGKDNGNWIFPIYPPPGGISWASSAVDAPETTGIGTAARDDTTASDGTGTYGEGDDGIGSDRKTELPWPHLVNGINVPEPGTSGELPGLDPIDPACTDPAVTDRRTHGQRLLDGLVDCLSLAARTGQLPLNGGMKPQLIISTTEADLQRIRNAGQGGGIAFLPYTGPNSLSLFDSELCDADVTTMILGDGQNILNVGRTQRLFTDPQRKLLIARDIGCTFPHCIKPASWCEAHHIIPWQDGGESNMDNGALLCKVHHDLVHREDWTIRLDRGIPRFTPTYTRDPLRRERCNPYHRGLIVTGA